MIEKFDYITDVVDCEKALRHLMQSRVVGYDVETTGLDPHVDKVTLAAFATKDKAFVVDTREKKHLEIFRPLFESEDHIKLAHNAGFEYQMTKGTAGIEIESLICTMLGEYALTAGLQWDGYGLEDVALKYCGVQMDKGLQKSFIGHTGAFSAEQLAYSSKDAIVMLPLAEKMQALAKESGVFDTWILTECAAIQAFGDIEYYGQKIDKEAWARIEQENILAAEQARRDLDKWFEPVCGRDLFGNLDINYDSQPQVLYALQMMGVQVDGGTIRDTSKKTQKKIKELEPIKALAAYRAAVKLIGTYGSQYTAAINPLTGRVHFRFNQYGTETGRPACRGGLNCLNIPRDKRYRNAFITDDDRLISTVDYSAAELRIMADLSGDPLMVEGFNSGVDFHCFVASMLFGVEVTKTNENRKLRDPTKTLNFGLAYGMGPRSLYDQLNGFGYPISFDECQDLFDKYKATFAPTIDWLNSKQQAAAREYEATNINGRRRAWYAPDRKKIRIKIEEDLTKKGRLTLTPDMENRIEYEVNDKIKAHKAAIRREGANFHIQSVNADFTKRAMGRMRKEFKRKGYDARMYNSVYDEIVLDIHKGCATEAHDLQKRIMIEEANKMLKRVPMQVEGHLQDRWTK
jgi:DNA polymerase-1